MEYVTAEIQLDRLRAVGEEISLAGRIPVRLRGTVPRGQRPLDPQFFLLSNAVLAPDSGRQSLEECRRLSRGARQL